MAATRTIRDAMRRRFRSARERREAESVDAVVEAADRLIADIRDEFARECERPGSPVWCAILDGYPSRGLDLAIEAAATGRRRRLLEAASAAGGDAEVLDPLPGSGGGA